MAHTFHIPVLGLAFSIDTPIKVAQYGISSVVSIVDDELIERMRLFYSKQFNKTFEKINKFDYDARAKRITAYLDLMQDIVNQQLSELKSSSLEISNQLKKYIDFLPTNHVIKNLYDQYLSEKSKDIKKEIFDEIINNITPGDIDVNIMSKIDKINYSKDGNALDATFTDAAAALRGFVKSKTQSCVVLSAGMNPKLYSYIAELAEFLPRVDGTFAKKIILKVSDYRSALIQAKFLAKKGVWISEYRIESGLNCGGHAFATDGYLLGPILEEFKQKKSSLHQELLSIYRQSVENKGVILKDNPSFKITVQGGIGTAEEHKFLLENYNLDGTGWGSPFLLVPEATTVDDNTLKALANATSDDFYVSAASPLGVPFNNFRNSTAEQLRKTRVAINRPGAPCTKKYLANDTSYSDIPTCTASRLYQHLKINDLNAQNLDNASYTKKYNAIVEKTCLCEGLSASAYLKYDIAKPKENTAVSICPGPNTAYFKSIYSLKDMVDHIYGRKNILENIERPHMFINELHLYIDYLTKHIENTKTNEEPKAEKYVLKFKSELLSGIAYYREISAKLYNQNTSKYFDFISALDKATLRLKNI